MVQQPYSQPTAYAAPYPPAVSPPFRRTKSRGCTILCALIPGAGQMYQGLMKRGCFLMGLYMGVVALVGLTHLEVLLCLLPLIWFYSFFDTLNQINMTVEELQQVPDQLPVGNIRLSGWLTKEKHGIMGCLLIVLAVWLLLQAVFSGAFHFGLSAWFDHRFLRLVSDLLDLVPLVLLSVLCIYAGVRLMTGGKGSLPAAQGTETATGAAPSIETEKDEVR